MAGDGRQQGLDRFDIAARRDDPHEHSDELGLSPDVTIPSPQRWRPALLRWSAGAVAIATGIASAFVLGRSFRPEQEPTPAAQELTGRVAERIVSLEASLAPDWTHTRGVDDERSRDRRKRPGRRGRHATVRVGGGNISNAPTMTVATAPNTEATKTERKRSKKGSKDHRDNKDVAAGPAEPELPDPALPLYHLYRTFKKKKPNHYFTGDAALKDDKIEEGYQFLATEGFMFDREHEGTVAVPADNGIPGYIYAKRQPGSLPLFMLRGYNGYGDIFTSDAAYKDRMVEEGWNDFGIVGYIAQT